MIVAGIWTEKGLGFVVPGFIPTPLGDFVQYVPTTNELLICAGIWAFGLLLYSFFLKAAIPIVNAEERRKFGLHKP
jgi:Ni/Fe-hydrogenase subunit HybB-like protein